MDGNVISLNPAPATTPAVTGAFKVDAFKGTNKSTVSRQWAMRPDDQRFLSLNELRAAVEARSMPCKATVVETRDLRVIADKTDPNSLTIGGIGDEAPYNVTHWTFGQIAQRAQAPAGYLRKLPAVLAAMNMQYGLSTQANELVQAYRNPTTGEAELRAVTGPEYGRIYDHELVAAVQKFAGNGTGDTNWKVPGMLQGFAKYNPFVDITKDTTTLFARKFLSTKLRGFGLMK